MAAAASAKQQEKRRRIVDAAARVFAEKGFHLSRISDIARTAGVADGTIYLYFQNKEDILRQTLEEKLGHLVAGLRAIVDETDDPRERLRTFAHYHLEQMGKNRAVADILRAELRLSRKLLDTYHPEKLRDYLNVFRHILEDGASRGIFRDDVDPDVSKWAFFGALDELGRQWFTDQGDTGSSLQSAARQVAEIFIRGLHQAADPRTQEERS